MPLECDCHLASKMPGSYLNHYQSLAILALSQWLVTTTAITMSEVL